jgi:hypothetical protein
MSIFNADDCRRFAERCRRKAHTVADGNEWVRFSQAWETIAAMSERLMAANASTMGAMSTRDHPP